MLFIFDLDGTLIDSHRAHKEAFVYALKKCGISIDKALLERIRERFGEPVNKIIEHTITKDKSTISKIVRFRKEKLFKEEISKIKLYPHTKRALKKLSKTNTLALATSSSKEFTERVLEKFGIKGLFKIVMTADDVKRYKPNPTILNRIIRQAGFDKKDAIYIGDTIYDYKTAENAHVKFIGILNNNKKGFINSTRFIKSIKEL